MKKLYSLLVLCSFQFIGFSQTINIPDANFKARLLTSGNTAFDTTGTGYSNKADINNDGEIQLSEAALVTGLDIHTITSNPNKISSLEGLQYFTNLKTLKCSGNEISTLDVSMLSLLMTINCSRNQITNINVSGLNQLKELSCSANNISTLNTSGLTALETLFCQGNSLNSVNFENIPALKNLNISENQLTTLNITALTNLEVLSCSNNEISQLVIANLSSLREIVVAGNSLNTVNLEGLNNLTYLNLDSNSLSTVDLSPLSKLSSLDLNYNPLTEIDVNNNSLLRTLQISNTQISTIDCSHTIVDQLICNNNSNLTSINVKNGVSSTSDPDMLYTAFIFDNLPVLTSICIDQSELWNLGYANYNSSGNAVIYTGENCDTVLALNTEKHETIQPSVYPNPFTDHLNVNLAAEPSSIEISDLNGRIISRPTFTNNNNSVKIDLAGISQNGLYILKIVCKEQTITTKILKQ
ncbi:T9SS type A sorting domain-containing protein [Flavobacterium cerinum]|uniref:T9SS type A sorting domain-containing protein n=1 Tax=Flavobacterium cerinum TaxID=2502784 RepID=A0A3S3R1T1_9FLAO|nr:T9SS type A sorting domain-containing protein [Flavobacterium cerinum]RWX02544.1 T9SS type A sorting domain-containing protein [Flavobacterium cerinum]